MSKPRNATLRVGVVGCSAFAARVMLPAILLTPGLALVACASRSKTKAEQYATRFHCEPLVGYEEAVARRDIDCLYIALPTGLHHDWVALALDASKHLLVEKSFARDLATTRSLIDSARARRLLVAENFSFHYHSQFAWLRQQIGPILGGAAHLYRANFSFPPLEQGNFRYDASLGGGALLDTGAYMVRVARLALGEQMRLAHATLRFDARLGVDIEGTATFVNSDSIVAQVAFGFTSFYQCSFEAIGPSGKISLERAYTPPPTLSPIARVEVNGNRFQVPLSPDHHYRRRLFDFACVANRPSEYEQYYNDVEQNARYIDDIRREALSR